MPTPSFSHFSSVKNNQVSLLTHIDYAILKFSWIILTTLRDNSSLRRWRRAGLSFQVRFADRENITSTVIIPNALITHRDGKDTDWQPLARHSPSPKTMQLFHAVAYICPSITSATVAVNTLLHTPQLYEGHFKFRPHVRTLLVQLGRGILSWIIILWYMEVFIWLRGSNVPYQA